jgi:RNA-directed DNA polymerase
MRSVPTGSFDRISALEALWRAWRQHARGKGRRAAVAWFGVDADRHVFALARALRSGAFHPDPYRQRVIVDPKRRVISAPSVRDRVLHQAIVAELAPTFTAGYIADSYACLPGRGPQRAVLRHLAFTRRRRYRLALDVARYFPSVAHAELLAVVGRRLRDARTLALLDLLVRHGGEVHRTALARGVLGAPAERGRGLPIGSCLSQWLANLNLDGVDQFVKRTLKVRAYLRYMDDLVLFGDDRPALEAAHAAVAGWLAEHRRLVLGPAQVVECGEPCTFLGYRVSRSGLAPGEKMRRRLPARVRRAARRGATALARTLASYRALVSFG